MKAFVDKYDIVVVGGGISGLAICRELKKRNSNLSILVLEKEKGLGYHSSGRNSGVLHSGIYYKEDSLKARFCAEGSRFMGEYCLENGLALDRMGKVIVPTKIEDDFQIDVLYERAKSNGSVVEIIDAKELKKIEPFTRSASGRALYSPNTSVIEPKAVLKRLKHELEALGVTFLFSCSTIHFSPQDSSVKINDHEIKYKYIFNAAGQNADKIAKLFNITHEYTMLPFKGLYYALSKKSLIKFNGLVYPVPDMNVPFLGIHSVKSTNGDVYFGPTAIPAFGRENYKRLEGIHFKEAMEISQHLIGQYLRNKQGFRNYAHAEALRFFKSKFVEAAQSLVPELKMSDLVSSNKVGIRTQLFNKQSQELVMDFHVETKENSTHLLNVVSPGFTSSFSFAQYIVNKSKVV